MARSHLRRNKPKLRIDLGTNAPWNCQQNNVQQHENKV
jgi:hypothetical protein